MRTVIGIINELPVLILFRLLPFRVDLNLQDMKNERGFVV